jgi:hypothetical protein
VVSIWLGFLVVAELQIQTSKPAHVCVCVCNLGAREPRLLKHLAAVGDVGFVDQDRQCLYVERNLCRTSNTSHVRVVPAAARIPCPAGLFRLAASNMGCVSKHNHSASGLHWGAYSVVCEGVGVRLLHALRCFLAWVFGLWSLLALAVVRACIGSA